MNGLGGQRAALAAALGAPPEMNAQLLVNGAARATTGEIPLRSNGQPVRLSVRYTVPALGAQVHGAFKWSYQTARSVVASRPGLPADASAPRPLPEGPRSPSPP